MLLIPVRHSNWWQDIETKYINTNIFLTYGDGLANINIKIIKKHHDNKNSPLITLSAVRPPARYGSLKFMNSNKIKNFKEKIK